MNRNVRFGSYFPRAALCDTYVQYSSERISFKYFHRFPKRNGRFIVKFNAKVRNIEHISHLDPLWTRMPALMLFLPHYYLQSIIFPLYTLYHQLAMNLLVVEENLSFSNPVVRLCSKCVIVLYPCDRRHGMTCGGAFKCCVETSVNSLVLRIVHNLWCQGSNFRWRLIFFLKKESKIWEAVSE